MKTSELIQSYYESFNRKDWSGMLSLLADDVVHDMNQGRREYGREAFQSFLESMHTHYDEKLHDICIMTNSEGTRAAAEFVCEGQYLRAQEGLPVAKGQKYQLAVGAFFEVLHGKITRVTNYYNVQNWLEQVRQ